MKKEKKNSGNKKENPWLKHLKEYSKKHPEKSYVECMSAAKATYNK
jgi:hypothetical protein